jgi:hypothetical protein
LTIKKSTIFWGEKLFLKLKEIKEFFVKKNNTGPLTVPDPMRSPGRTLHPLEV